MVPAVLLLTLLLLAPAWAHPPAADSAEWPNHIDQKEWPVLYEGAIEGAKSLCLEVGPAKSDARLTIIAHWVPATQSRIAIDEGKGYTSGTPLPTFYYRSPIGPGRHVVTISVRQPVATAKIQAMITNQIDGDTPEVLKKCPVSTGATAKGGASGTSAQSSRSEAGADRPPETEAGFGGGVFRVGGGVTPPMNIYSPSPEYSEQARATGLMGTVTLYIEVGPDGLAHNVRVQRSLGMGLDEKAIEAVQKWRFKPGMKDGKSVTVAATIEINFRVPYEPPSGATQRPAPQPSNGAGVIAPTLISKVEPEYSDEARKAKHEGTVVLQGDVGPDGRMTNIRVRRSLGLGLDEEAIETVKKWRFKPGTKNGVPVTVATTVEVNFRTADATVWDPFEKSVQALDINSANYGTQAAPQPPPPSAGATNSQPAVLSGGGATQPPGNALALLREVADAARATKTWLAEGRVKTQTVEEFSETTTIEPFKLARDGLKWRYEATGGPNARIQISDGATFWEACQPAKEYTERGPEVGVVRVPPVLFWDYLTETLPSGMLAGEDNVELSGVSQRCEIVRGEAPGGEHSLCIDRARKLVLRDSTESSSGGSSPTRTIRTITFSMIERDPKLPPDALQFRPPTQAVVRPAQGAVPLPPLRAGVFRPGNGVTPPRLLQKVEPELSEQARKEKVGGTVVLYLEVGPDGVAHNIRVTKGVGFGLDEKAIEAVQKWRFSPGKKDGKPVTVGATIEVNFRIL